jgi:hypothetical protein
VASGVDPGGEFADLRSIVGRPIVAFAEFFAKTSESAAPVSVRFGQSAANLSAL